MQVFDASCLAKIVTVENMPVATATILSEGNGSSTGIAILEKDKQYYLTSNATDIKALIASINDLITKITTVLTSLDGVTNAPGASASNIALITAANAQLLLTKELLK
jgi:hypothetical protein